jgi:cell division protein FtsL
MKKQYIFLTLLFVTLYILYLILSYKYREYKINSNIDYLKTLNQEISLKINEAESLIDYKTTRAYKNKILKEQQGLKNKWEKVVYLTSEQKYNKYIKPELSSWEEWGKRPEIKILSPEDKLINSMTNYEKWMYFIFNQTKN